MNSFKIYTPVKKFYHTPNVYIYGILAIGLLPVCFESVIFPNDTNSIFSRVFAIVGLVIYVVGIVIFGIIGHQKDKPLKGIIKGDIVFDNDRIIIDEHEYPLAEIENIRFPIHYYYRGLVERYRRHNLNGRMSLGVENVVVISFKNGKSLEICFQLIKRYQIRDIRPQLVHYHNEGKLDFLHLIDILGIEDYNAIQIFKKSLPEGGDVKSY